MKTANPRKEIDPMNTNNTQYRIIKDGPAVYHFAHTSEACAVHHHSAVLPDRGRWEEDTDETAGIPLELLSDFDNPWYRRDGDFNYYSGTVAELLEMATGKTNAENARGSFARKVGRALLLEMEIAGLIEEIEETED